MEKMSFQIICCVHQNGDCTKLSVTINDRTRMTTAYVIPLVQNAGFKFVDLDAWPPRRTREMLSYGVDFVTFVKPEHRLSMDACVPVAVLKGSKYVAYVI
jgi:hypothetical protein